VRLRRDFDAVLNLVNVHAILHQSQRQRDKNGRIVARLEDYRAVYNLVSDIINEGVQATVNPKLRETVEAVQEIIKRMAKNRHSKSSWYKLGPGHKFRITTGKSCG